MSITTLNIPIKHFKESELEEIWLTMCSHVDSKPGYIAFDFRKEVLDKLSYPELPPFKRIRQIGVYSNEFTDIIYQSGICFPKTFLDLVADSVFYLADRLCEVSVRELEHVCGVGPYTSRRFHHWVRPRHDEIVCNTVLLSKHAKAFIRDQGFYVPKGYMDWREYRRYEQVYSVLWFEVHGY